MNCACKNFFRLVKITPRLVHPGYSLGRASWEIEFLCTLLTVRILEPGHLEKINQSGRSLRTKDSNFFP